jgi:L-lactate dehydrogenase complex protein LldG
MMPQTTSRNRILQRLRAAPKSSVPTPDVATYYKRFPEEDLMTRIEKLASKLTNARAEVHRTKSDGVAETIAKVISEKSLKLVAVGPEVLARDELCTQLEQVCTLLPIVSLRGEEDALFTTVNASVTLSHAAIAQTGSIVFRSASQSPRMLSLVPPVHIAIVDAQRTFSTLHELMHQERWADSMPTNMILVSSPSKTADIEETMAYGAHGPMELVVILVENQA